MSDDGGLIRWIRVLAESLAIDVVMRGRPINMV